MLKKNIQYKLHRFSSVQLLSHVWLFATPWIAACQASLSITNSRSLLKLMSIKSVMPSSHLILHCRLLLLPPIPPSIRVFSNESTLRMRWPKHWSFSLSISPSDEHKSCRILVTPGIIASRLLHPWDSPRKNTGVGCHFLLQSSIQISKVVWKRK